MNQPRRPRLIVLALLAILAAALALAPAYSSTPTQSSENSIQIAERAQAIAEQLRLLAQSKGLDTQQLAALIQQGTNLLNDARTSNSQGNYLLALTKAREAQAAFRDSLESFSASSIAGSSGADQAAGILVAVERARLRIGELRAAIATYQNLVPANQQSAVNVEWANANLTTAESNLKSVENLLKGSSPDVSSAALALAQAEKSIALALKAMHDPRASTWRIPGFVIMIEKLVEKTDGLLKAAAARGVHVQDLQAKILNIRELVSLAKGKVTSGNIREGLELISQARALLRSIERDLAARAR